MNAGGTSMDIAGDHWIARGYYLKTLIAQIYDIDERRIDLAENGLADALYDVSLTLPREVDENLMLQMLRDALQKKFRLNITAGQRSMDVYVLSAPNGPGAALHRHGSAAGRALLAAGGSRDRAADDVEQIAYEGKNCSGIMSGNGIEASAGTISEFRRTLEPELDRLLVDETNLRGSYDFKIGNYANQQDLFKLLHEELGIVVTPTQRKVTTLTVRTSREIRAAM